MRKKYVIAVRLGKHTEFYQFDNKKDRADFIDAIANVGVSDWAISERWE